jgi:hypothetical protein
MDCVWPVGFTHPVQDFYLEDILRLVGVPQRDTACFDTKGALGQRGRRSQPVISKPKVDDHYLFIKYCTLLPARIYHLIVAYVAYILVLAYGAIC